MISKNTFLLRALIIAMSIIFITPWGYVHYSAIILLPIFSIIIGNKNYFYNKETLLLILFSLAYAFILILNSEERIGVGSSLKYIFVPVLCYQTGKYFAGISKSERSFVRNILILMFVFSIVIYLSIVVDIYKFGYLSILRNIQVIGEGEGEKNATGVNAIISIWLTMIGFFFYKAECIYEKKYKYIILIISIVAILFTLRLGSRTGMFLLAASSVSVIFYNFRRYNNKEKFKLLVSIAFIIIGLIVFADNSGEVLIAYAGRAESEQFGVSTAGGRTEMWFHYAAMILDYPFGSMPSHGAGFEYAHNYFIDIARVSGIIPLAIIFVFTLSSLWNLKRLLLNNNISLFARNLILVLNVAFITVFMVEPVIEGSFSLFMMYLFVCGISSMLVDISLSKNNH